MTTSHANCDHPATKADRAACRQERAARLNLAHNMVAYFDEVRRSDASDWLFKGAHRFNGATRSGGTITIAREDRLALALALLDYFAPLDAEVRADYYRANGYTITRDPGTIRSILLRAFS